MIYQCMFAVITPALITGAIAERMSFSGFLMFSHPVGRPSSTIRWRIGYGASAAGFIKLGALDFAGGTVVHISSGVSALAAALVIGKRMRLSARADAAA